MFWEKISKKDSQTQQHTFFNTSFNYQYHHKNHFSPQKKMFAVGLTSAALLGAASATSSFYENPSKIFTSTVIDGHKSLVSSVEKSSMKVSFFLFLSFLSLSLLFFLLFWLHFIVACFSWTKTTSFWCCCRKFTFICFNSFIWWIILVKSTFICWFKWRLWNDFT